MKRHRQQAVPDDLSRREFLKRTGVAAGLAAGCGLAADAAPTSRISAAQGEKSPDGSPKVVSIVCDPGDSTASSPPVQWAVGQLKDSLAASGISIRLLRPTDPANPRESRIVIGGSSTPLVREFLNGAGVSVPDAPESLALVPGKANATPVLLACGSDARGLVYAVLELADRVKCAADPLAALRVARPVVEKPANVIRSVARLFASDVEDKPWLNDRSFWPRYLSMLAAERFNRFSLTLGLGYDFTSRIRDAYFYFAYPFLVSVPGYEVRAVGLPDAERERNLQMLRLASDAAVSRGLHFQLGLWTHAYKWTDSPNANYTIEGLTPANHAAYCRDALRTLLVACPAIGGVTFRVHGESGVPEGSYAFWKTVFDGIVQCGRRVEIDMHAKGMDQAMIDVALATGMTVNISPKYWAEHMGLPYHQAAIRALELPRQGRDQGFFSRSSGSRSFLRYGYGDLLSEKRPYGVLHRIWPGTQRLLLWGDPVMAAGYGRASSFCGSRGVEICEPLSFKGRKGSGLPGGRTAYEDASFRPAGGDWEKYRYTYRLWGRLLYNPDAQPETWRRSLRKQFAGGALAAEAALAHASRILPLLTTAHLPSAANNNFWPEIYTNMPIVDAARPHPYGDTPSPKRFGTVSPLDPELFSRIDDFADELLSGQPSGKYSPVAVAQWLQDLADAAARHLADAETRLNGQPGPEFRRLAADVAIQIGLGRFFAWKLRAGVFYALYARSGDRSALLEAQAAYRTARSAWWELAQRARGVYVRDITFGWDKHLRGHWLDRLPAIDQDIADMEENMVKQQGPSAAKEPASKEGDRERIRRILRDLRARPDRPSCPCDHKPPAAFRPGQPLAIELAIGKIDAQSHPVAVGLHYRHVHQAETYRIQPMQADGQRYRAVIPADYTKSSYPLEYLFQLRDARNRAWLHPGFRDDLSNQPYFVVRRTLFGEL